MLYKVKFPDEHDKSKYRQMGINDEKDRGGISKYSSYFNPIFYQTLVFLNDKKDN